MGAYDLHIHSGLSPCADEDMTPNNIVGMACLKGLSLISITDHNSGRNLPAFASVAKEQGIAFMPGIELCTREEVHLLAYFRDLDQAMALSDWCAKRLPDIKNKSDFFGRQLVIDADDKVTGEEPRLLISALDASLEDCADEIRRLGGAPVPAHINRQSHGLLGVLGFLPPCHRFAALEVDRRSPMPALTSGLKVLFSSDAHSLGDILEAENAGKAPDELAAAYRFLFSE